MRINQFGEPTKNQRVFDCSPLREKLRDVLEHLRNTMGRRLDEIEVDLVAAFDPQPQVLDHFPSDIRDRRDTLVKNFECSLAAA